MSDDDILDMSFVDELELNEQDADIEDNAPKGLRFGFIGAGQAGCNLVQVLREKKGYRRTLFFNTTHKDIEFIPKAYRIVPSGYDGAGKDRSIGAVAANAARGDITIAMTRYFKKVDFIFICSSAAGGSGSGATKVLAEVACDYLVNNSGYTRDDAKKRIGVIAMLPKRSEGGAADSNAYEFVDEVLSCDSITPILFVDNERVARMTKDSIGRFDKTNTVIAQMFDVFNSISASQSTLMTFDPKDYTTVMQSGLLTVGINTVKRYERDDDIAKAIRLNLSETVLVDGFNISGATHAAIIITGPKSILESIPNNALENARTTLLSMMGSQQAVLHVGVYISNSDDVRVVTIVGGFPFPKTRLDEMKSRHSSK